MFMEDMSTSFGYNANGRLITAFLRSNGYDYEWLQIFTHKKTHMRDIKTSYRALLTSP